MAQQSFMWTALPNGYTPDGKSVRLSVILSPRLDPAQPDPTSASLPRLSSFYPDWEDWPSTIKKATFEIRYGSRVITIAGNQTSGPNRIDTSLGNSDSLTWRTLFKGDLFVRGFQFKDLSASPVLSYDTMSLAALVQNLYTKLGEAANGDMPLASDILEDPDWNKLIIKVNEIDRKFTDQKTGLRDSNRQFKAFFQRQPSRRDQLEETLENFQLFHTPLGTPVPVSHVRKDDNRIKAQWLEYERRGMPLKEDFTKQIDFHQILAAMNPYPTMLRRLGIVIDFILKASLFEKAPDQSLSVSVHFPPGELKISRTNDASPATRTLRSDTAFQPVSNPSLTQYDSRVVDGLLNLDPEQYGILQLDVDSAGLKIMNFCRSLSRIKTDADLIDPVTRNEKEVGAPSLRNTGFMLVHHNRSSMLKNRFNTNKEKNIEVEKVFNAKTEPSPDPKVSPPQLWAEDIVRGSRIDIWDSKISSWLSLCKRRATYDLDDSAVVITPERPEEGTVRLAATRSSDPTSIAGVNNLFHLHEVLISWTGWSIAAPPPGRAIMPDDQLNEDTTQTDAELPPGFNFKTTFRAWPHSLPRLRLGHSYWIRARVVDLAGNSLPPKDEDFGPENPIKNASRYLRFEPILAPGIALVRSQANLTERPGEGESMEHIAIRSFNETQDQNTKPTDQIARRFVVPPRSSVRDAEVHGKLDASGVVDKTKFDLLANQKDLDANDLNSALQNEIVTVQGTTDQTSFAVYNDGKELTYLPDPMAEAVAVRISNHPNISESDIITIPLYPAGTWPDAKPFKIHVFEDQTGSASKPSYDAAKRSLLLPLPKAVRAKLRLSMTISKEWLSVMGVWNWFSAEHKRKLERMALLGQHWMLTPWRTLEAVHAVQRPLIAPNISKIKIHRGDATTWAKPEFIATCSIKSTDRLDLLSEWHVPMDDPSEKDSEINEIDSNCGDVAFSIKIVDPKMFAMRIFGNKLGGFAEYMVIDEDLISVNVVANDLTTEKFHEFHDTRYRRIEYWLQATTKFREYLPESVLTEVIDGKPRPTEKNIVSIGPRYVTWIPSSAPPPAPDVLYVIPTFRWMRIKDDINNQTSLRLGGGLRVYLNRPWNISGYGEMLAVVLPPESFGGSPDDEPAGHPYKNYVTQWGNDPIWLSTSVSGLSPKQENFPLSRTSRDDTGKWLPNGSPPAEKDQPPWSFIVRNLSPPDPISFPIGGLVDIAPHDVFYDEERRLWYCDIEIDSNKAYYPFIRLALARYQPVSLYGSHLSKIVLADFMPLAVDRWLTITHTSNPNVRHVAVYGDHYRDSSGNVEAKNSTSMSTFNLVTGQTQTRVPAIISSKNTFEVWVEIFNEQYGEDFGWEIIHQDDLQTPITSAKKILMGESRLGIDNVETQKRINIEHGELLTKNDLASTFFAAAPLWEHDVTIPDKPGRYRLVIAEYEEYLIDDDRPYDNVPEKKERRLVFVEHIELT
jgi:hypothetical protein